MSELPGFIYWECPVCEFNAITRELPQRPICPICAEDNGRDVEMKGRAARSTDKVEGADARPK